MKTQHAQLLLLILTLWIGAITNTLAQSQPGSQSAANALDQLFSNLPGPDNPEEIDQRILKEMKAARIPGFAAVVMKDGKIIDLDTAPNIKNGGSHPYTEKLIGALPSASGPRKKGLLSKPKEKIIS